MMRLLVSLCVAGVVVYALIPPRAEPDWNAPSESDSAPQRAIAQIEAKPPFDRKLRSWGPTLQALGRDPAQSAPSKQFGASLPLRQETAYGPGGAEQDQEVKAPAIDAAAEPIAWAKIVFAARAHRDASVSSPITKLYPAGAELQVVGRKSGWLQLLDPTTFERGWIFENYLVSIEGPTPTRAAIQSAPEPRPVVKAAASKSQTPRQSSKQAVRAPDDIEVTRADRRQERSARVERRGLFGFFRNRDARPAAWSVGSPR